MSGLRRVATIVAIVVVSGAGLAVRHTPSADAAVCFERTWVRTEIAGTSLHPRQGWLRYDCATRVWALGFRSELPLSPPLSWASSKLRTLEAQLNSDNKVNTGCGSFGIDHSITGSWNGSALVATITRWDDLCTPSAGGSATISRLGTQNSIELRWNQSQVGYPRAFTVNGMVSSVDDPPMSFSQFTPGTMSVSGYQNPGWANAFHGGPAVTINGTYDAVVSGDFNGDRRDDVLFYGAGAKLDRMWLGTPSKTFALGPATTISGVYDLLVAGDFNGNGRDDVVFYGRGTAPDALRFGSATGALVGGPAQTINGEFDALASADFNNDNYDDVLLHGAGIAKDVVRLGTRYDGFGFGPAPTIDGTFDALLPADYNGNGRGDVFFYGAGGAPDELRLGATTGALVTFGSFTVSGTYTPASGDFDGNGWGEILWYAPGAGSDAIWQGRSNGTFIAGRPVNIAGTYEPVVGDFNGDGRDDVLLYGPGTAPDALLFGNPPN
ncbi:MAG TPA: VCBS repeat-containing protein [Acidimicrobiia bacterium]|nr:VCBS repeat-containing protein [Acidimicrobiia bacterium]